MAEQDARGALAIERQEGKAEGRLEGRLEGRQEGRSEGIAEGKRETLLRLLVRRGIALAEEDQARVAACTDTATLDRWFDRALEATTAAEVFA